jgi:hypothetical protein
MAQSRWSQTDSTDAFQLYIQTSTGVNLASGGAAENRTCTLHAWRAYTSGSLAFDLVLVRSSGVGTATNVVTDGATAMTAFFIPAP